MTKEEEVDKFYTDNYYKLINYIRNGKKGGDGKAVVPDDAVEVLHDTYCYHKANPETFDKRFIWNVLKQRRMNYLRNRENYNSMKDDFFHSFYKGKEVVTEGMDDILADKQIKGIIKQEIREIRNGKHKTILTAHIINGQKIPTTDRVSWNVVQRFRKRMVEKYGGD